VVSLEKELKAALRHSRIADERKKNLLDGLQIAEANRNERLQSLESKYGDEIDEYLKQIKLAEEVLAKKKEERDAMIEYLITLNLTEHSHEELRSFDWNSLQRLVENLSKPSAEMLAQRNKASDLNELAEVAGKHLDEMIEQIASVEIVRDKLKSTIGTFQSYMNDWQKLKEDQEKRISKVQADSEKLNLLLRQCVASNEPLSEYVTKNVQAKCQSFVYSDPDSVELLDGLRKFKTRQDRIIELLRHKDSKLGSETNKLQVARDQTHDQLKFYVRLIEQQRNAALNRCRVNQARDNCDPNDPPMRTEQSSGCPNGGG